MTNTFHKKSVVLINSASVLKRDREREIDRRYNYRLLYFTNNITLNQKLTRMNYTYQNNLLEQLKTINRVPKKRSLLRS